SAAAQPVLENFIPLRRRVHRTDTLLLSFVELSKRLFLRNQKFELLPFTTNQSLSTRNTINSFQVP
ncbi:MAG: hypothetical protein JW915_01430, partial [Chitinispirillaceae bacterium]|nr:hypothetical protein [Chitinispirillaceae bacterium]